MSIVEQYKDENSIQRSVTVPVSVDRAFILFTEELGTWWPREYTWAGEVLEAIGMETRKVEKASE